MPSNGLDRQLVIGLCPLRMFIQLRLVIFNKTQELIISYTL